MIKDASFVPLNLSIWTFPRERGGGERERIPARSYVKTVGTEDFLRLNQDEKYSEFTNR